MAAVTPARPPGPPQDLTDEQRDAAIYYLLSNRDQTVSRLNLVIDWATQLRSLLQRRSIPVKTPPPKIT